MDKLKGYIINSVLKSSDLDRIYPEFMKNLGSFTLKWLTSLFNNIFISARLLPEFKKNKVIAIFKKEKPPKKVSSYRLNSLLGVCNKILERMI